MVFGSAIGGSVCSCTIHLSILSMFLQTCWHNASKSKRVHEGVAVVREIVGVVVESMRGAGRVVAVVDECSSWRHLLGGQKGNFSTSLSMAW